MKVLVQIVSLFIVLSILLYMLIMAVMNLHFDIFALSSGLILFLFPHFVSVLTITKKRKHQRLHKLKTLKSL